MILQILFILGLGSVVHAARIAGRIDNSPNRSIATSKKNIRIARAIITMIFFSSLMVPALIFPLYVLMIVSMSISSLLATNYFWNEQNRVKERIVATENEADRIHHALKHNEEEFWQRMMDDGEPEYSPHETVRMRRI